MRAQPTRKRFARATAGVVSLLLIAACSSSGESAAGDRGLSEPAQRSNAAEVVLVRQQALQPICEADLLVPAEVGAAFGQAEQSLAEADELSFSEEVIALREELRIAADATPEELSALADTARSVLAGAGGLDDDGCLSQLHDIVERLEGLGFVGRGSATVSNAALGAEANRQAAGPAASFGRTFGVSEAVASCASSIYDSVHGGAESVDEVLAMQAIAQCQN